jgi:hypothetical protein
MYSTTLHNAQEGHQTLQKLWAWAKPRLLAGQRLTLTIGEEKRNVEQNAKFHALLGEIARQVTWAGKKWDAEEWKRLVTAAWLRSRREYSAVVPALDGHGVDVLYRHTSKLSKAEFSELIEYTMAWAAQNGVECAQ